MDDLPSRWLYELQIEDSDLINQCQMAATDLSIDAYQLSPEASDTLGDASGVGNPGTLKPSSWLGASTCSTLTSTHSQLNSVITPESPPMGEDEYTNFFNLSADSLCETPSSNGTEGGEEILASKSRCRPPLQARNHVTAERKRRERLNQMLISLAALIPGLKKMDKASILGDASQYIKQLEERVQKLELDCGSKKDSEDPTVCSKRARSTSDDERSAYHKSSDDQYLNPNNKPFPEVDIRVSDKHVLLKIHCKKQDSVFGKILQALAEFSINVVSTSILPFADSALDITVIGEMCVENGTKMENPLKSLRLTILKLI